MDNLRLEVLVSCMNQKDMSIVERSAITSDVLIINQCDCDRTESELKNDQMIRRVDTMERGLSNSRNMAIGNAKGDVCLLCDDDETMEPGYENAIIKAFENLKEADIIIFRIKNQPCKLRSEIYELSYLDCLKVSSWQIAFRKEKILGSGVRFDPHMGAGSGNGGGEENKFLCECHRCGLKIYSVPEVIASVAQEASTWFHGYDKKFFYQRGIATRYMLGFPLSVLYAFYYAAVKRRMYSNECSMTSALGAMLSGIWNNDIEKQKNKR